MTRDAVALLPDGRTALLLTRAAQPCTGETVLVEAAAGGVGSLLVQLARLAGARTVGAVGSASKMDIVSGLGADLVVDYSTPDWTQRVAALGGVNVVFDGVGGQIASTAFDLLRPGGRFVPFGMASGAFATVTEAVANARAVTVVQSGRPSAEALRRLTEAALAEAVAGRLHPLIGQIVPLAQAAHAHAAMERRATVGKTLLAIALDTSHPNPS